MKMLTLVTIIAMSMAANAETPVTTTAPVSNSATTATSTEVKTEVKKVEKKTKKVIKKVKPSAKNIELKGSAVITSNESAMMPTMAVTDTMPAAGTSTATVIATATPAKKWSAGITVNPQFDSTSIGDVQTLTNINGAYQVTDKMKMKLAQTFETLAAGNNLQADAKNLKSTQDNNFRPAFTDLSVSSALPAMIGSDAMPVSLMYRNVNGDSLLTTIGAYKNSHGFFQGSLSIPFTISPKWSVSLDNSLRNFLNKVGPNSNRLASIPTVSYNINDMVSVYQSAGYMLSLRDNNELRRNVERMYLETGISMTPVKNLSISLDVNQDKAIYAAPASGVTVSDFNLYKPVANASFDSVSYEAIVSYNF